MNDIPEKCSNCGFETEEIEYFDFPYEGWLCKICSSTHLANENMDHDHTLLAKSIAYIGNMILKTIKELK